MKALVIAPQPFFTEYYTLLLCPPIFDPDGMLDLETRRGGRHGQEAPQD